MVNTYAPISPPQSVESPEVVEAQRRVRLQVSGVVQGVGFRPFVHHLATEFRLHGFVRNDNNGVFIEVEGAGDDLSAFQQALARRHPPLAHIEQVTTTIISPQGGAGFAILHSESGETSQALVSPDIATCDECLRELFDPSDRRYRYPFINCTNCGPRFTIIQGVPYDRPLTTMVGFHLCPQCQQEYEDPGNRRFHAQPNACPHCGPQLTLHWLNDACKALNQCLPPTSNAPSSEEALQLAQRLLARGAVVGVKGVGGYHLACDATNDGAVATLRQRKNRGDKPFAIMARDLPCVLQVAHASAEEIKLLTSSERPIVLLRKRANSPISPHVAPGNSMIGVMLPYTPLHHLLFALSDGANQSAYQVRPQPWLVMTSGNCASQPIVTDDEDAAIQLQELADALLTHNRPIHVACDDSVLRVHEGAAIPIRRSRGYAPLPIYLPHKVPPALAVGGEIKNTFCLAKDQRAFLSQHIGDMQSLETEEAFAASVAHMQKLFNIEPKLITCDLHPGYLSTRWAEAWAAEHGGQASLVRVQHHHAHIAALMAEHGLNGAEPVIGFCFDGTGYGADGAIWGGELLVANYRHFERHAHLAYLPLPGGDAAIHKPYRMALAALWAAGIAWDESLPPVQAASSSEQHVLRRQLETGLNCVPTSSMGRLFDIVASLCGLRQTISYEAQAAIELEQCFSADHGSYRFALPTSTSPIFDATPLISAMVDDVLNHVPKAMIASRFHNAVADLILEMSIITREQTLLRRVALSGGVFQNTALLQRVVQRLHHAGFETLCHRSVPPNDGGLVLGQIMVAAQQEREACV